MESNMKKGNYDEAISIFLNQIEKYQKYHLYGPPYLWIISIIVAIGIAVYALTLEKNKLKLITTDLNANNYFQDQEIENQHDRLTNTQTKVIPDSNNNIRGRGGRSNRIRIGRGRSF
jgi:hypothetical protein